VNPDSSNASAELRRGEFFLWLPWALGTLVVANVIGGKLLLIYVYGWSRVSREHLRLLSMPKGRAWPVSNGDLLTQGHFIHFLISSATWLLLFFPTYLFLRLLLPRRKG
jgi:hypothetical protein